MTTTTLTTAPQQAQATLIDASVVEADIRNASTLMRSAASALAEAYVHDENTPLTIEQAKHRYALANALQENLATVSALIGATQTETAQVILAAHKHGDNIDIEGATFHRYDETKHNAVSWKAVAEKATSFLSGSELGSVNRMKKVMQAKTTTYFRLKQGVFKGKAE